jgi:hypothetical protein
VIATLRPLAERRTAVRRSVSRGDAVPERASSTPLRADEDCQQVASATSDEELALRIEQDPATVAGVGTRGCDRLLSSATSNSKECQPSAFDEALKPG